MVRILNENAAIFHIVRLSSPPSPAPLWNTSSNEIFCFNRWIFVICIHFNKFSAHYRHCQIITMQIFQFSQNFQNCTNFKWKIWQDFPPFLYKFQGLSYVLDDFSWNISVSGKYQVRVFTNSINFTIIVTSNSQLYDSYFFLFVCVFL